MGQSLIIRHETGSDFKVIRAGDGKAATSEPVELADPRSVSVKDRRDSNLSQDLRWYLERFLDYPFEPNTAIAEDVQAALSDWGKSVFEALFVGQALIWYSKARDEGLENLTLKIASDDPGVLAWPWEALADPDGTTLAQSCRIERQLSDLHDPLPLPDGLPQDRINLLLVIARPYGDGDVGFHALSRPLIDLIEGKGLPVHIDVLRPPTFDQLEKRLKQKPGYYHIVHFDGHGEFGDGAADPSAHNFRGPAEGKLVFESDEGGDDPISAGKLTQLLTEYRIPIMVLNACQSAMNDDQADDPFASVAAALMKAGIRSVVAMGYNLFVSGAQQFVPAFYERLLETGEVAEATRSGRKAMLRNDKRVCARGEHSLQDWLVPVLYQQAPLTLAVGEMSPQENRQTAIPEEARDLGDYGFIGRERAVHALERALLRQPAAAILIHGMAGVGKTTLAKGCLRWLEQTNGLHGGSDEAPTPGQYLGIYWLAFDDIRSAEFVINSLISMFDANAIAAPMDQKEQMLIEALRANPILMVWDNFESAAGIEGTEVTPLLTDTDRQQLKALLNKLRGGRSKVLITSRSQETWLSPTEAFRLPLGGLRGEECWEYCQAVVRDLGLVVDRTDESYAGLMETLDGHPLAMRAVLLRLAEGRSATQLAEELEQAFAGAEGDESTRRIFAALGLLDRGLPVAYGELLALIGLHRRYVEINYIEHMVKALETPPDRPTVNGCFEALERGGLLHHRGNGIYAMHPALSGYLSTERPASEAQRRAFVGFMGTFADQLTPKLLHEQREHFLLHGANFHNALAAAHELTMDDHLAALTQSLANHALKQRDFATAERLFGDQARLYAAADNEAGVATPYHQLGRIAEEQRQYEIAEQWYLKSLAINEKQGNEHGATVTYHHLGRIAEEQRQYETAEQWYLKSLAIKEKQGNEHGAAGTYHQLGSIALVRRQYETAEQWYLKSLAIIEKQGNEHDAASTYHQLGIIAQEQRRYETAEQWYLKSLAIKEKQGNEHDAASTYHHLGIIAQEQRQYETAEQWYLKSLAIKEKQGDERGAATTYGQLGLMAQEQRQHGNAGQWALKAIAIFARTNSPHFKNMAIRDFVNCLRLAESPVAADLRQQWEQAGLNQFGTLDELEKKMGDYSE